MSRRVAWLAACCLTLPGSLAGQFSAGLWIGGSSFSGAARGRTGSEEVQYLPYRPTSYGLLAGWGRGSFRLEGAVRYGEPGLALRGVPRGDPDESPGGVLIVSEHAFRVTSFAGGASLPVLRLREGPVLRAAGALTLERWSSPGSAVRTVAGVQAGLALEVGLSRSLSARAEAELGFTPASPFRPGDLPDGVTPRSTWRRSLAAAVVWWP
jgi:hypothetical protein